MNEWKAIEDGAKGRSGDAEVVRDLEVRKSGRCNERVIDVPWAGRKGRTSLQVRFLSTSGIQHRTGVMSEGWTSGMHATRRGQ